MKRQSLTPAFYIFIFIAFGIILVLTCLLSSEQKGNSLEQPTLMDNSYNNLIESFIEKEIAQYKLSDLPLKGDSILIDSLSLTIQKKGFLFVFKFDEFSCDVCIKEAFSILDQYEGLKQNDKFYIIVSYQDERKFKILYNMYKEKYNIINIKYSEKLYLSNFEFDTSPIFFVLDNKRDLTPKKLFFFLKELPEINQRYLDLIGELM